MPTITISLPKELKERLDKHKDINWPEVFRTAFEKKIKELEEFRMFKEQRGALKNENISGPSSKNSEEL